MAGWILFSLLLITFLLLWKDYLEVKHKLGLTEVKNEACELYIKQLEYDLNDAYEEIELLGDMVDIDKLKESLKCR